MKFFGLKLIFSSFSFKLIYLTLIRVLHSLFKIVCSCKIVCRGKCIANFYLTTKKQRKIYHFSFFLNLSFFLNDLGAMKLFYCLLLGFCVNFETIQFVFEHICSNNSTAFDFC